MWTTVNTVAIIRLSFRGKQINLYGGCMKKTKLAICMADLEYQTRFVSCFMNHYNHQYELHVFTTSQQMEESNPMEYAVIITGEYTTDELAIFVEKGEIILKLEESFGKENVLEEKIICTEKYQEVYKIVELIQRLVADKTQGNRLRNTGCEWIGVYSLTQEMYQAPFAALLGKIYGEQQKVLVLDLQSYSGLNTMECEMGAMGLEDLLSVAQTGNYSKGRVLECIRHEFCWDYICSVQNQQCLAEGTKELYESMIEMLVQELGYEVIIINFGSMFMGQLDLMEMCHCTYLLNTKCSEGGWREQVFEKELLRQGKENLLQAIRKIEIVQNAGKEVTWRSLAEKWTWGQIGEMLRQERKKEIGYGAVM